MFKKYLKKYVPSSLMHLWRYFYDNIRTISYFIQRPKKIHTYAGYPLTVYISNPVSADWYDHDCNRNEITFLKKYKLMKGARVFDIGAHEGIIALIFSKIIGDIGEVIAIEMDNDHIKKANINKQINHATNLNIIHAAVAENIGTIFFSHDQIKTPDCTRKLNRVKSISIDALTRKFGYPSIVYIDIEGYEYNALKGAKKTLLLAAADWCIEIHVKCGLEEFNGSVEKIISCFPKSRFNLYMAPSTNKCKFIHFNNKNSLVNMRFYLIAINRANK
jgi:FkbM family methyltransferase